MGEVCVLPKWQNKDEWIQTDGRKYGLRPDTTVFIDTTSGSSKYKDLSPFILGPCQTYVRQETEYYAGMVSEPCYVYARNFENLWQYSKVYQCHIIPGSIPPMHNNEWYMWRIQGWRNPRAVRYPMGKGVKPVYLHWKRQNMDYITARKRVYAPEYTKNVIKTGSFKLLQDIYKSDYNIVLLDYDAYDHRKLGMTLKDVINNPDKKCGHAFVLMMILTGELEECIK